MTIHRAQAEVNPEAYLPDVAMTAANMSRFNFLSVPNQESSLNYVRESLAAGLPYLDSVPAVQEYVSLVLNVVKQWGLDVDIFLQEFEDSFKNTEEN